MGLQATGVPACEAIACTIQSHPLTMKAFLTREELESRVFGSPYEAKGISRQILQPTRAILRLPSSDLVMAQPLSAFSPSGPGANHALQSLHNPPMRSLIDRYHNVE